MNARDLNLEAWGSSWGDPAALEQMAAALADFNTRLLAEGKRCAPDDLREIQGALNALATAVMRVERIVAGRVTALRMGACHGR